MLVKWKSLYRDTLTLYVRVMCAVIGVSLGIFAVDLVLSPSHPHLESGTFEIVRTMMPLATWGLLFWLAASLFVAGAISGRFAIYAAALTFGVGLQVAWFVGILTARFVNDAPLASSSIGLWVLALSLTIGTAFIPHSIEDHNENVIVVDDGDNTVVELRRSG